MQSRQEEFLYEYAIIRYLPRVERHEFVNIGLIMMCKKAKWAKMAFELPCALIQAFGTSVITPDEINAQLSNMRRIALGEDTFGELSSFTVEERYRWLTAVKSACLQTSPSHPGITDNLEGTFAKIYQEMVVR